MTASAAWRPPLSPQWTRHPACAPTAASGAAESLDIWRWQPSQVRADEAWLSASERQKARALPAYRRHTFIVNRRMLRHLLAPWLDHHPRDIAIGLGASGRPFVEGPAAGVDFNLSHSGDLTVLAIGRSAGIGIDIERPRRVADCLALARRLFPPSWIEALEHGAPNDRQRHFQLMWTRFEACQKSHGHGVFAPRDGMHEGYVRAFQAGPGCVGHLCLAPGLWLPGPPALRFFHAMAPD